MIIDKIDSILSKIFKSERLSVLMTMFLVFYGGIAAPKLPNLISKLFENPIFRVFILSLILYKGNSDPQLSVLVAIVYIVILDSCNKLLLLNSNEARIEGAKTTAKYNT